MAIKEKKVEQKGSKFFEVLSKEYKHENLILGVLAFISLLFSVLILTNVLTVNQSFPVIGDYPNVFGWILFTISAIGLLIVIIPYFTPSIPELKKIDWPRWRITLSNSIRVFIFIIALSLAFLAYELFISGIMKVLGI